MRLTVNIGRELQTHKQAMTDVDYKFKASSLTSGTGAMQMLMH